MAFIIPNAVDTTSGNKYSALDQAEPDSIDFEILGNSNSGVINGCQVSPTSVQGNAVSVDSGFVILNGIRYELPANTFVVLPTPPSTSRFDLIVARLTSGAMAATALYGSESSTNPTLPKSKSRLVSVVGLNPLSYFNPDTDVVLASVYRFGANTITAADIVDKRKSVQSQISFRGATAPNNNVGSVGDLYLQTGQVALGESGVFVKRSETEWSQLATAQTDPGVPVGTIIPWLFTTPPNNNTWIECNGAALDPVLYPALFAVTDYEFGQETGTTRFYLPDLRGMYLAGLPASGGSLATPVGNPSSQVSLTMNNIPRHQHSMDHGHSAVTSGLGGRHQHRFRRNTFNFVSSLTGAVAPNTNTNQNGTDLTEFEPDHTHSVTIPPSSGYVTGFAGNETPTPINIQPRTMYVKYFIRYA